jgi:hypothetical protein
MIAARIWLGLWCQQRSVIWNNRGHHRNGGISSPAEELVHREKRTMADMLVHSDRRRNERRAKVHRGVGDGLRRASASRADIAQGGGAVNALTLWCRIHRRRRRSHFRRCGASTRADRTVRTGSNARCGTSRLGQRALAIAVVLAVTVLVLVAAAASFLAERAATSEYVGAVLLFQLLGAAPTKDVRALRRRTHHLSLADVTASVARHSMLRYTNHCSA